MTNQETLSKVDHGYRMSIPNNCPLPIYEVMLMTWAREEEKRPTFDYLQHFFEDYSQTTEGQYVEQ